MVMVPQLISTNPPPPHPPPTCDRTESVGDGAKSAVWSCIYDLDASYRLPYPCPTPTHHQTTIKQFIIHLYGLFTYFSNIQIYIQKTFQKLSFITIQFKILFFSSLHWFGGSCGGCGTGAVSLHFFQPLNDPVNDRADICSRPSISIVRTKHF